MNYKRFWDGVPLPQGLEDRVLRAAEERPVRLDELGDFTECGLCGTAAVISPVGTVDDHGREYHFGVPQERSVISRLYTTLLAIQHGELPAPDGWIMQVD